MNPAQQSGNQLPGETLSQLKDSPAGAGILTMPESKVVSVSGV